MNNLTLHYAPDNASLCVRLALLHLDVTFDPVLVDRARQGQRDPSYLELNPNGLIPTLETPQGVMFETTAILLWLDGEFGGLMPENSTRAMALKWLIWIGNTLHPAQRMMFYPDIYCDGDPELIRAPTRRRIKRLLQILSDANDADWLEGPPSAMGFYLGPLLRWCALYGGDAWFDLADYPRLLDFAHRIEQTDVVINAATAEGLGATPFSRPSLPNPPQGSAV